MKKTACITRKNRALRRVALVFLLLLLLWLTPFYHLTPGQVSRREAKDWMLEDRVEILETRYLWEDGALRALQLSAVGEDTLLVLSKWSFPGGWQLESASRAQPGNALDAGFLQCAHEDGETNWSLLASFGRLRSPEVTALSFSAKASGVVDGVWTEGEYTRVDVDDGSFPTRDGARYFLQFLPLEVGAGTLWDIRLDAQSSAGDTLATRTSREYWDFTW